MAAGYPGTNDRRILMLKFNLAHAVGRVRLCGLLEGASFVLLLLVAMPLKYAFDMPLAVRYVGMAHGFLFVLYVLLILLAWLDRKLTAKKSALAFVASLIPFGPFIIDGWLAEDEKAEAADEKSESGDAA
jgi:integral membrane protein